MKKIDLYKGGFDWFKCDPSLSKINTIRAGYYNDYIAGNLSRKDVEEIENMFREVDPIVADLEKKKKEKRKKILTVVLFYVAILCSLYLGTFFVKWFVGFIS